MTDHAQTLTRVAAGVIEDAAFLSAEPAAESDERLELQATIAFELPHPGWLRLATSERVAAEIAGNMLGLETDDHLPASAASEGLGELANVLVGVLLVQLFGAEQQMAIGIPEVGPAPAHAERAPGEVRVVLDVEGGGALALTLSLEVAEGRSA